MTERIISELKSIEEKEGVTILLAVESGSRAWGFDSPDSDYDVRFIYVRRPVDYLMLDRQRDVLEYPINDLLDISGWDFDKALRLLHNSNPTLYEWFDSRIIYHEDKGFKESMAGLLKQYFSRKKCIGHYLHMARNNSKDFLKGEDIRFKKYFYVLRSLLAAKWIMQRNEPAPILFEELVDYGLDESLKPIVSDLLKKKRSNPEIKTIGRIGPLNDYIDSLAEEISAFMDNLEDRPDPGWDSLNDRFQRELGFVPILANYANRSTGGQGDV